MVFVMVKKYDLHAFNTIQVNMQHKTYLSRDEM